MNRSTVKPINPTVTVLWASAFVIAALVITQAGRLPANPVYGEVVADRDSYTLLTTDSGRGGDVEPDEVLLVIDNNEQALLVYEIEDARRGQIILRDSHLLNNLFTRARR